MERNKLFRARFILLKSIEVMQSYKRKAESDGEVEGVTAEKFQEIIDQLTELEAQLHG